MLGSTAHATVWSEAGEAGTLPGTSQGVTGVGPLNQINGTFPGPDDIDMYLIRIIDPNAFSASGSGGQPYGPPRMFLFDASGVGVAGYFDSTNGGASLGSANVTNPGLYYLAYSGFSHPTDNVGSGQPLWLTSPTDVERAPDGPGSANPVAGWTPSIVPYNPTPYTINLTGAAYVPEPGTGVLAMGFIWAGLCARRRRST